jgi:hypothetical protein
MDQPSGDQPPEPPPIACPWCPYTAPVMKAVLHHMEARHHQRWQDLALSDLDGDRGHRHGGDGVGRTGTGRSRG